MTHLASTLVVLLAAAVNPVEVYVGLGVGVVLTLASVGVVVWYEKRRRSVLCERPPQQSKLLRPPGYSLFRRLDDLNQRWLNAAIQIAAAGCIAGITCSSLWPLFRFLWTKPDLIDDVLSAKGGHLLPGLVIGTGAAALVAFHGLLRLQKLVREVRGCHLGLRGEEAVGEALNSRRVRGAGYVVFHDVPTDGPGNVDHVAIGPGGVFVIETKTRSKRKATRDQSEAEVRFDGQVLQFPWGDDPKAARQVERNAAWVRRFIGDFGDKNMLIQPILVLPGWYVTSLGNYAVKAMNAKYLEGYLSGAARQYTDTQLEPIISRFDERCRTLEF